MGTPSRRIRRGLAVVGALLVLLPTAGAARQADGGTVVVQGGWLFDGTGDDRVRNPGLVIRAGEIMEVGDLDSSALDRAGARVVDLDDDQTILPGLFDVHAHFNVTLLLRPRTEELHAMPVLYLANGVTSAFPNGEYDPEGMMELRKRVDAGHHPGPRIFNSGPYYGSARPGWDPEMTRDELYAEVDHWVAQGVKGFKAKGIGPDHLRWLIERAHWHGLPVSGHLDSGYRNSVNPRDAILMGIDRIEHFQGGHAFPATQSAYASFPGVVPGTPEFDDITDLFIRHGVYYSQTLSAYGYFSTRDDGVFDHWTDESRFFTPAVRASFDELPTTRFIASFDSIYRAKCPLARAYYEAGGLMSMGTDHVSSGAYLPAFGAHRELHAMVNCGIPEAEALKSATVGSARVMRVSDRQGTLEVGKLADLFVVRGNPLEDIRNTRNVEMVMKGGVIYDPAALLESVEGTLEPPFRPRPEVGGG